MNFVGDGTASAVAGVTVTTFVVGSATALTANFPGDGATTKPETRASVVAADGPPQSNGGDSRVNE
jgi:hypothetical protein